MWSSKEVEGIFAVGNEMLEKNGKLRVEDVEVS